MARINYECTLRFSVLDRFCIQTIFNKKADTNEIKDENKIKNGPFSLYTVLPKITAFLI